MAGGPPASPAAPRCAGHRPAQPSPPPARQPASPPSQLPSATLRYPCCSDRERRHPHPGPGSVTGMRLLAPCWPESKMLAMREPLTAQSTKLKRSALTTAAPPAAPDASSDSFSPLGLGCSGLPFGIGIYLYHLPQARPFIRPKPCSTALPRCPLRRRRLPPLPLYNNIFHRAFCHRPCLHCSAGRNRTVGGTVASVYVTYERRDPPPPRLPCIRRPVGWNNRVSSVITLHCSTVSEGEGLIKRASRAASEFSFC